MLLKRQTRLGTLLLFISALAAGQDATYNDVSIQISGPSSAVPAGSKVTFYIDVANATAQTLAIPDAGPILPERSGFDFEVTRTSAGGDLPVKMTPYLWNVLERKAPRSSVVSPDAPVNMGLMKMGAKFSLAVGEHVRFTQV